MNKKKYIKPEVTVVTIPQEELLQGYTGSQEENNTDESFGNENTFDDYDDKDFDWDNVHNDEITW